MKINKTFIIWLFLVVLWNYGVPQATPFFDVFVAIILSFVSKFLEKKRQ
tara:strand:+ start:1203 stop:1349 length:147 start_codon:yes stop_codon:yes gene_type:complete